jgi:hypothetical protein
MKRVWIVEQGEYSDYSIVAIFATQAQAEEFVSHRPTASVREWELNTWTEELAAFEITFDLSGNITEIAEEAYVESDEYKDFSNRRHKDEITFFIRRGPRDRAIKIASEQYAKIRVYLDQADTMMERAEYNKIGDHRFDDALCIARILAGIDDAPTPPRCTADRNILTILGMSEVVPAPA